MKKYYLNIKLFSFIFFFFLISLISLYNASFITKNISENIVIKQLLFYILGVVLLTISYKKKDIIFRYHKLWYISFIFLLGLLLIFGIRINGSRCWIILGPFSFQPSEFMKISLIISISIILSKEKNKYLSFITFLKIFIITLIPSILTFLEPDTGVVIIYFIIMISLIISYNIKKKWYFFITISLLVIISIFLYLYFFEQKTLLSLLGDNIYYRLERIFNWKDGNGYQLENSLIAIASSGIFGFGIKNLPIYYPEASTDFIFTTIASSFGFLGSILFLLLIINFDISIFSLVKNKIKKVDKYLIIGFSSMIIYQQFQNISMTIGLLPITGITLPFISYGGSSLLSYMFIMGIILRISHDKQKYLN